ncbi:MAG TPA: hypothetical protein VFQ77_10045 [Pseudonocardiaceae bacterium]|nr:hypothetical protein [Pseudonocardiaceae bacterium]
MEALKAYSHTPAQLDDLRKTVEVMRGQRPGDPDDTRNETASRPTRWALADRLSPEDVQAIIDLYREGTVAKDLATKFAISVKSVRRLLNKHNVRRSDQQNEIAADRPLGTAYSQDHGR